MTGDQFGFECQPDSECLTCLLAWLRYACGLVPRRTCVAVVEDRWHVDHEARDCLVHLHSEVGNVGE